MSISDEIDSHVRQGRLFPLLPMMPPAPGVRPRQMFLGTSVMRLLAGPWNSQEWEERCGSLHADLDRFVQGGLIPVAERPFLRGKTAYMRQLFRWREQVWEIRSRDPQPGIRVLGRFADTDVFIALNWFYRTELGGPASKAWRDAIVGCKTEWRNLFPAYEPKPSGDGHDYPTACISNTYLI
jgi:hypothetical protein